MSIPDSLPDFSFFLDGLHDASDPKKRAILVLQLALKCAICTENDWEAFDKILNSMKFSYQFEEYIRLVARISRSRDRSALEHFSAVSQFRRLYPDDPFLDRPFCRTVEAFSVN
jgi:hypothetical protein